MIAWLTLLLAQAAWLPAGELNAIASEPFGPNAQISADFEQDIVAVLDRANFVGYVLSPDFELIGSFGGRGQGPGEFQEPAALVCDAQNQAVLVFDTGRKVLMRFGYSGKFLGQTAFAPGIQAVFSPSLLADGQLLFTAVQTSEDFEFSYVAQKAAGDFSRVEVLAEVRVSSPPYQENQAFWSTFVRNHMEAVLNHWPLLMAAASGDSFWLGHSDLFDLERRDAEGRLLGRVRQTLAPRFRSDLAKERACERIFGFFWENPDLHKVMTDAVFKKAMEMAQVPPVLQQVEQIFAFGEGMGVLSHFDWAKEEGDSLLFNRQGKLIRSLRLQGRPESLAGTRSHLYTLGTDDGQGTRLLRWQAPP